MNELAHVQPGDRLVTYGFYATPTIVTVERTTKTQVILTNGIRVSKTTERAVGSSGSFTGTYYRPATKDDLVAVDTIKAVMEANRLLANAQRWSGGSQEERTAALQEAAREAHALLSEII